MVTHSCVLAWRIPGAGEPDELPSMGLHRVGRDRSDLVRFYIYGILFYELLHLPVGVLV